MFRKGFVVLGLLFCLVGCFGGRSAEFTDVLSAKSADGVSIAYADYGQGDKTLVFVHGWSCDSRYWNKQIDYFAKNYRVLTIDMAGHGNSGTARDVFSVKAFGQDVAAVLDAADVNNAVLIGHSMGGSVVLEAALLKAKKVIAVIGVDTLQDMGHKATEEEINMYLNPMKEDFKTNAANFVRSMFPANADKKLVEQVANDMASADKRIALSAISQYFENSAAELVSKVDIPIKCLNADLWPNNIERNKSLAKDYELTLMEGYGHFIMLEAPNKFNSKLEAMIESI